MKLPEWLAIEHNKARQMVGVGADWRVTVKVSGAPGGDDEWDGASTTDSSSLVATVEYGYDVTPMQGTEIALHENLHILHAELDQFAHIYLQGDAQAIRMYEAINDRFITRLAQALARSIDYACPTMPEE